MAKKDVIERCNRYLNDNLNMVESYEKLTKDFTFDITILGQKNVKSIVEEYTDYILMLKSTYRDYRFNVENFERYVLRLNSVISSSLIIEYRVHDLLYDNYSVLKVENRNVTQKEFLEKKKSSLWWEMMLNLRYWIRWKRQEISQKFSPEKIPWLVRRLPISIRRW